MKKIIIIIFSCIFLCLFSVNSTAFIFSPTIDVKTKIPTNTISMYLGKSNIQGHIYGYNYTIPEEMQTDTLLQEYPELSTYINESFPAYIKATPLLGTSIIPNIDRMTLFNISAIQNLSLPPSTIPDISDYIEEYTNVDLVIKKGFNLFLTTGEKIQVFQNSDFGIHGFAELPILNDSSIFCLLSISEDPLTFSYTGNTSYIYAYKNSSITLLNNGSQEILWSGDSTEKLFQIEEKNLRIHDTSSLHLIPLEEDLEQKPSGPIQLQISMMPSESSDLNLENLLRDLENSMMDSINVSEILNENETFIQSFFHVLPSVLNGGFLLFNTSSTVQLDSSQDEFVTIGFARGGFFTVNYTNNAGKSSDSMVIEGSFRLVFLGDHFYSPLSANDDQGIAIPLLAVITWTLALAVFVIFNFVLKNKQPENRKTIKVKPFDLVFLIGSMIVVFILMDLEISTQFGTSFITLLFAQGLSVAVLLFVGIQLFLWGIGYIACAVPLSYVLKKLLGFIGINEEKKKIAKGISIFFIWIFTALYVTLLLNILLMFIDLPSILSSFG